MSAPTLPPPATAPSEPPAAASVSQTRVWTVGTLSYTAGGLAVLFCWLLWGDFAWSMKERSVTTVVQIMLKQMRASDMVAGIFIGSLPSAITMILGPVISYRSDRHRGRWGRRIPYLVATTPVTAIAMFGLAFSPALGREIHALLGDSSPGLQTVTILVFGLVWTVFEIATVAANAVFTGLINDVVPHAFLGRFYGLFRALSLIAGMVFSYFILGKAETHYPWIFIGVGLLYGIGFTVMCLKVKEGGYPPPPPVELPSDTLPAGARRRTLGSVRQYFRECFGNGYYVWIFLGISLATLSFNPVNLFSVFHARSLEMSMELYGRYVTLTFFCSLVLAYPLGWLSDRIHPLRSSIAVLALYVLTAVWGGANAHDPRHFAVAFVLHCVLSGCFFTCSASLGQRLFPRSRFAQFASVAVGLTALGTMTLGPLLGRALDRSGHPYHNTYYLGATFAALGLAALLVVHRRWMRLGGPRGYLAPE